MQENSSKYVDTIAMEKLLSEKLRLVSHDPDKDQVTSDCDFSDFSNLQKMPDDLELHGDKSFSFCTPIAGPYIENNRVRVQKYPVEYSKGAVIFLHGLYEDNLQIYEYFVSLINKRGLDVYLMQLPYHYERKPVASRFSGEYFFSAQLNRSAWALKQTVYELYQLNHYLKQLTGKRILISGFSMGGGIVLALAGIAKIDGAFCINPVCQIAGLVWDSSLFSTIRHDLEQKGREIDDVRRRFAIFEPLNSAQIVNNRDRVFMGWGIYDQINTMENYQQLIDKWGFNKAVSYKAGHLNILRVPKLAIDLTDFYFNGKSNELL